MFTKFLDLSLASSIDNATENLLTVMLKFFKQTIFFLACFFFSEKHRTWFHMGAHSQETLSSIFSEKRKNKQIPWGIYVPRLIFFWGDKNGNVNQRTIGHVSIT